MNEILKVDVDTQMVSARELHNALEVSKRFPHGLKLTQILLLRVRITKVRTLRYRAINMAVRKNYRTTT